MHDNPYLELDKTIIAASGTSAETDELLYELCDRIGTRFPGTLGYRQAAEYMLGKFETYGLENCHLEPFEFLAWRRGKPGTFSISEPFTRDYACFTLPYSGATPANGVTGQIIDIDTGTKEDFFKHAKAIKGKIILTNSTGGHRTEIYDQAIAHGAIGFVFYTRNPGMLLPTGTVANGEAGTIPAIGVGYETVLEIQRLSKKSPLLFNITTDCSYEKDTTWNVVGDLKGSAAQDELVIMGGHLDSHDIGPCAYDNGAGAIAVIETARLMATLKGKLKRTVRFVGFAAEEIGLLGSHYHASQHAAELQTARFMLNADMPGLGWPKGIVSHMCNNAKDYIEALEHQMQTPIQFAEFFHSHSDHYPFILEGVPTAGMISGPEGAQQPGPVHTSADTPDKISILGLRDSAMFAAKFLVRASNDENWPIPRRNLAEIKKLHADKGIPFPEEP